MMPADKSGGSLMSKPERCYVILIVGSADEPMNLGPSETAGGQQGLQRHG
jgi:hypothetical protein